MEKRLRSITVISSFLVSVVSGSLLFLWIFDPEQKEFSAVTMKANTSLGLFMSALSLYLLSPGVSFRQHVLVGKIFAFGVFLIGFLTGLQYLSRENFGIDELLVRDFINQESHLFPGRMSPIAAACFVLIGLAFIFRDLRMKRFNFDVAFYFLIPVLVINFQAIVGYIYGTTSLYQVGPYIRITWQTAICFQLLVVGALFSRPLSGPINAITSTEAGGVMARILLPFILFLPIALGWLRLLGQRRGFYGLEEGLAFLVVTLVVLFSFVITLNAKVLNHLGSERKKLLESEKKARKEAELEREKLHSLFLQAPTIISLMRGPNHVFELFNNEARKTVDGRDFTGLCIREALPELEGMGYFEALDSVYQTGKVMVLKESPAQLRQMDGSFNMHYFNVVYHPWLDYDGKVIGILNVSVDVSEQVLARLKVEEALRVRDEFINIASHELRTPITSLKLQLQMTRRAIKPELALIPSAQKLQKLLEVSDKQLNRLTVLVETILDVVRIQAGRLKLELGTVNLASLIRGVIGQFSENLNSAKSLITLSVDDDITGMWDSARLEQVFSNLLTNSTMYAPGAPIEIMAIVNLGVVQIIVRDKGPGIPKINQSNLFQRFERAGQSINVSGLGLSLYISKQIIEAHGGIINMESEAGDGASFIFELPLNFE